MPHALVLVLLPLPWVVQIHGCSGEAGTYTGAGLFSDAHPTVLGLVLAIACVAIAIGCAWAAGVMESAGQRLAVHVVGLFAAITVGLFFFTLMAGVLVERRILPAGYVVLIALVASVVDASARVVLGFREWLAARRAARE